MVGQGDEVGMTTTPVIPDLFRESEAASFSEQSIFCRQGWNSRCYKPTLTER
jgi:hypothetical protein